LTIGSVGYGPEGIWHFWFCGFSEAGPLWNYWHEPAKADPASEVMGSPGTSPLVVETGTVASFSYLKGSLIGRTRAACGWLVMSHQTPRAESVRIWPCETSNIFYEWEQVWWQGVITPDRVQFPESPRNIISFIFSVWGCGTQVGASRCQRGICGGSTRQSRLNFYKKGFSILSLKQNAPCNFIVVFFLRFLFHQD